jgi:hypothetical protein
MPTGSSSNSVNPPREPDPPFGDGRRHSWLASHGWYPVTWAAAALVLLGGSGAVFLLHEPGRQAQAQTAYCGLVTCAVLRSAMANSSVPAGDPHPTPASSSSLASPPTPVPTATTIRIPSPTPSPRAAAVSTPTPAPSPRPTLTPAPTVGPAPWRWPRPSWWPPSGRWGPARGDGHGYPAAHPRDSSSWPGSGR